jgi:hypothetical protein
MSSLWVPPTATKRQVEERNAYTASVESMVQRFRGVMNHLNPLLKEVDPHLELIFVPPNADPTVPGIVPGRYMVMRHNPGAPPSLMVVEGPNGEFVEPGTRLVDEMREMDMWSPEAERDRKQRKARREYEAQKAKEREAEDRRNEIAERWAAVSRTFVSMDRSSPWSQNHAGRRGRGRR